MALDGCAAVILAAGGSSRFGAPKQLLDWGGRPLITHIADTAWAAGLSPVVVVLGAEAELIAPALAGRSVQIVRNYRWAEGMSTSLTAGIGALPIGTRAAICLPVDQPLVSVELLQALFRRWQNGEHPIVAPSTEGGHRGTPVLFDQQYFQELATLSGDSGGRVLLEKYAVLIEHLPVADPLALEDIDTPAAYEQLLHQVGQPGAHLDLRSIRGIICDMDGVLWRGDTPLDGLQEFIALAERLKLSYLLVTNNSSRSPQQYVEKLARMGAVVTEDHILNSAMGTAGYLRDRAPGASVHVIGGPGIPAALQEYGLHVRQEDTVDRVDYVVVGWDQGLTWWKLATATRLLRNGAQLVSTNPDITYPLESGLVPGNGSQVLALEAASGKQAVHIGKPAPILYEQAMALMGTPPEATLVIGDRLDTDILGGLRLGMPTALVLTGISQRDELAQSPIRPDLVYESLMELVKAWPGNPRCEAGCFATDTSQESSNQWQK